VLSGLRRRAPRYSASGGGAAVAGVICITIDGYAKARNLAKAIAFPE
jgi:hypothetical protein